MTTTLDPAARDRATRESAALETGRLSTGLRARTAAMVFGTTPAELAAELRLISTVDLAHVVMLARQDLLDADTAGSLLREIRALRAEDFASLHGVPAPRGAYLMYENQLAARLGDDVGGKLHTGRSRNDLKATTTILGLRAWLTGFLTEALRLESVLLGRARAHREVVMPVYTHFQAAMPITYGHYLLGVAVALGRDLDAVLAAAEGFSRCPMGACAVAGTDLPLDPALTARLLGFSDGPAHAVDAVASRDVLLRVLAAVAGLGITLSRLGTDLQLWSSAEFGLVAFPDRLVGGSSAMPQKRNAFLLEHVKAKAGAAIGAWTAAAAMTKSTPFTNTIEVGTEAVAAARPGLAAVAGAVLLCQVLVGGATPVADRMSERAERGFTMATAAANRLVRAGTPFRAAHHAVGAAVRTAVATGTTDLGDLGLPASALPSVVAETDRGGGPGAFDSIFAEAAAAAAGRAALARGHREALLAADSHLDAEVTALAGGAR
ncbi:lyase family protein [Actinokineospora sp. NBRC 105648]|uniref:lyase family protein n=1 Tax=Actinokineospora sp. NBRC 105648 TaxID=3032206 RepID=UPI0024A129EA|nr:lyase family protein [Actinokineospora sp. NBRC 105648]GLZ37980.1 argininosuccinate lyase [Actinokineospora sp. NBRC 105648]